MNKSAAAKHLSDHPLCGVGVALITPFDKSGNIDFKALDSIVERCIEQSSDFLVVMGTTGEAPTLTDDEKTAICNAVVNKNRGRLPVVLGVGGNATAQIANKCKNIPKGVDYILSVAPYYNKPPQEGLFKHFEQIANSAPVPIIVYNIPSRTGVNVDVKTLMRLANEVDGIVAVKEASGSLAQITDIISSRPSNFAVLSGDDAMTFPLLCMGGDGVISTSANALSAVFKQMLTAVHADQLEIAREYHYKALPLMRMFFEEGNPAGIKAGMSALGLCENILRLPLIPVSEPLLERIKAALKLAL